MTYLLVGLTIALRRYAEEQYAVPTSRSALPVPRRMARKAA
jgi:hypothetical protein